MKYNYKPIVYISWPQSIFFASSSRTVLFCSSYYWLSVRYKNSGNNNTPPTTHNNNTRSTTHNNNTLPTTHNNNTLPTTHNVYNNHGLKNC